MLAVSVVEERTSPQLGLSLPALLCVICGAATHYDPSRLSRLMYLLSAAAGLLIVIMNSLRHGQVSFLSEQVAIASMLLVGIIAHYGISPSYMPGDTKADAGGGPVKLNGAATPCRTG
jgi:ABC-type multidrug transport system permease subunit